jgi:hypothetical protein
VKSASEEDALLKLCVIVCTILKKNMQVGCHISIALKDQLILKIVYDKNLSLICRIFLAVLITNYLVSLFISVYMKVWQFHETLQLKYGNLFGRFLFKIVDTQSFIRRFPRLTTGLSHVVENSIAAAPCQQLATSLLKTVLLQLCHL